MKPKLMGKKRGMTQLFDESGTLIVCTVIEVEPNVITQIKTDETDGYYAIQTGFETIKTKDPRTLEKRCSKPLLGHYNKSETKPRRYLMETRLETTDEYKIGQQIGVDLFSETEYVDVIATSIGKGYQGAMKLYHFRGQPASHGAKKNHRSMGSTGNRSTPGRCFPGGKRACHMGNKKVTVQNLKIVEVNADENLIVIKGPVPGPRNGLVTIGEAKKKVGVKS